MKFLVLAAGQGTRLRPLTDKQPKCMVKFNNIPIIDYILNAADKCGLDDIAFVTGYKANVLRDHLSGRDITFFHNDKYAETNMVESLMSAKSFFDEDVIVSYSDIVYSAETLHRLMVSTGDVSVVVDESWIDLWSKRMENPLDDAEKLIVKDGRISQIGQKAEDITEIEAQYIGLIKIKKEFINKIFTIYNEISDTDYCDGLPKKQIFMTTLLQLIADKYNALVPLIINGGWLEIDSCDDLNAYKRHGIKI